MAYGISGAPSAGTYHPLLDRRFQQPEASDDAIRVRTTPSRAILLPALVPHVPLARVSRLSRERSANTTAISAQFVLRRRSCVISPNNIRARYNKFFSTHARWHGA
jgi:hypothetical protein